MTCRSLIMAVAAGCVIRSVSAGAGEWRQYRGPHGDGTSADPAINLDWKAKSPVVLWSVLLGDEGWSNPALGDGRVFVMDHEGKEGGSDVMRALDLNSGKMIWSTRLNGPSQNKYGYTASTPALDDGKLYCVSRTMRVSCLDAATGKELWWRDALTDFSARSPEKAWGHSASPLVDSQQVYLVPGGAEAAVVALDKATGATRWQAPGGAAGYASPVFYREGPGRQVVVFNSEGLIGFNPADGRRLWTLPWVSSFNQNSATPLVIGKRILITSSWRMGAALVDITDTKPSVVWKSKDLMARFSSPVQVNGYIYGVSEPQTPGQLVCLDAATGETKWKQPGFDFGPLAAAGGAIIVVNGKTGDVVLVEANPAVYKELGRVKQDKPVNAWNMPIVAGGKMLVRNQKSLCCLDVAP